jgi:hypothetical protein
MNMDKSWVVLALLSRKLKEQLDFLHTPANRWVAVLAKPPYNLASFKNAEYETPFSALAILNTADAPQHRNTKFTRSLLSWHSCKVKKS